MADLKMVDINHGTLALLDQLMLDYQEMLNETLILRKNAEYGNSWQQDGPFVAAGRMKDKISRVVALYSARKTDGIHNKSISQQTTAEAFQDVLEMMCYGKLLLLYLARNHIGLAGTEDVPVQALYMGLVRGLDGYGSGGQMDPNQEGNSTTRQDSYSSP